MCKTKAFKDGDWIYWSAGKKTEQTGAPLIFKIGDKESSKFRTLDVLYYNKHLSCYRLATKEEIQEYLITEAKRRGFREETDYREMEGGAINTLFFTHLKYYSYSNTGEEQLTDENGGSIYKNGKWATIVSQIDELEKTMNKKIIGYKCIKAYPGVKLGATSNCNYLTHKFCEENPEFWKPICEEDEKIIIGEYKVFFHHKFILIDNQEYYLEELLKLRQFMMTHSRQVKSFNVGCNEQHKVDLPLLDKIIVKLQDCL